MYLADKKEKLTHRQCTSTLCSVHCVFAVNDLETVFGNVINLYHFLFPLDFELYVNCTNKPILNNRKS